MPSDDVLTDLGLDLLADLPSWARPAPEFRAIAHAQANESERIRAAAVSVRNNLIPARADELGLPWWETMLKLPVAPAGDSVDIRRARVLGALGRAIGDKPLGLTWEANVTALIGGGWTYEEQTAPNTTTVTIPYPPDSAVYLGFGAAIRPFSPAHVAFVVASSEAFALDDSLLDTDAMT